MKGVAIVILVATVMFSCTLSAYFNPNWTKSTPSTSEDETEFDKDPHPDDDEKIYLQRSKKDDYNLHSPKRMRSRALLMRTLRDIRTGDKNVTLRPWNAGFSQLNHSYTDNVNSFQLQNKPWGTNSHYDVYTGLWYKDIQTSDVQTVEHRNPGPFVSHVSYDVRPVPQPKPIIVEVGSSSSNVYYSNRFQPATGNGTRVGTVFSGTALQAAPPRVETGSVLTFNDKLYPVRVEMIPYILKAMRVNETKYQYPPPPPPPVRTIHQVSQNKPTYYYRQMPLETGTNYGGGSEEDSKTGGYGQYTGFGSHGQFPGYSRSSGSSGTGYAGGYGARHGVYGYGSSSLNNGLQSSPIDIVEGVNREAGIENRKKLIRTYPNYFKGSQLEPVVESWKVVLGEEPQRGAGYDVGGTGSRSESGFENGYNYGLSHLTYPKVGG